MKDIEVVLLLTRIMLFWAGISALVCGTMTMFFSPVLIFMAISCVIAGIGLLVCCVKSRTYMRQR